MRQRIARLIVIPILLGTLSSCGGGGGGGGSPPPPPPPSGLSYTPSILIVGQAMTPVTPTVTGQVSSYAVSPALPTGLSLNTSTGVISGTPTTTAPQTNYIVTASNTSGKTAGDASLTIVSNPLAYPSSSYVFTPGVTSVNITPLAPVTFTKWTVSPALPAGLTLDSAGTISGQPSTTAAAATYTVTASGPDGQETTTLSIAVAGAPILKLGLSAPVIEVRYVNASVLSVDNTFTWLLQDFASGTTLATGTNVGTPRCIDLENDVMIDESLAGLEVRSATTGSVQATITPPAKVSWYRLAVDGSYIAAGSPTGLTVWSPAGTQLFTQAGDYSTAAPFAAAGQLQVANGPAGANVIQTFAVPTGTATTSPQFQGTFNTWFVDGQRFITNINNAIWTYSNAAALQEFTSLAAAGVGTLGGSGTWYWNSNFNTGQFTLYQIGSGGTAALTLATGSGAIVAPSGTVLGVFFCCALNPQLTVIDLSGATPVTTNYTNLPFNGARAFGAKSPSQWLVGTDSGIVLDGTSISGTPRSLTLGAPLAVAVGTSFISVATAVGKIFVFNASDDSPAGTLDFAAWQLAASADGSILAAAANPNFGAGTDFSVNLYALPAGTVSSTFASSSAVSYLTMSATGNALGELNTASCAARVISLPAGTTILCDNSTPTVGDIQLSPDGTLIADSNTLEQTEDQSEPITNLYKNGTLVTILPGYAAGWLSNSQVLLDNFGSDGNIDVTSTGTTIYDASGNQVSRPPLLGIDPFQLVPGSSTALYDPTTNTIVSLSSGSTTWASGDPETNVTAISRPGGVTNTQVVFTSNNLILAQPY